MFPKDYAVLIFCFFCIKAKDREEIHVQFNNNFQVNKCIEFARREILYSCGNLYENAVEKNIAGLLSNTLFLNESKRLAFLWRWLCGWKLCLKINAI